MVANYGTTVAAGNWDNRWVFDGNGNAVTWRPNANAFVDMVYLNTAGDRQYLIGLGDLDSSAMIVQLDANDNYVGYAYARTRVNWKQETPRKFYGFGAGYVYGNNLYFSMNSGYGVVKVRPT